MLYVKRTSRYILRNFPRLLLAIVPMTVYCAFFFHPVNTFVYAARFAPEGLTGFRSIFFWLFRGEFGYLWYMHAGFYVLLMLTACYIVGIVEKDFKVGRLSVRSPLLNINNTFPPVFKAFIVLLGAYLLFKAALMCLMSLFAQILLGADVPQYIINLLVAATSGMVFFVYPIVVRAPFLSVGTMLLYGYTFRESYGVTLKISGGRKSGRVMLAMLLPFAVQFAVSYGMVAVQAPFVVYYIVDAVMAGLMMIYFCVLVMTAVYDLTGIERRDKLGALYTRHDNRGEGV